MKHWKEAVGSWVVYPIAATTTPPGPPAAHTLSNALVPGGPAPPAEADLHSGSSNDLFTTEMRYGESEQGPGEAGVSGGLMIPISADPGVFMLLSTSVPSGFCLIQVWESPKWIGVRVRLPSGGVCSLGG